MKFRLLGKAQWAYDFGRKVGRGQYWWMISIEMILLLGRTCYCQLFKLPFCTMIINCVYILDHNSRHMYMSKDPVTRS